eukprot:3731530-Amphidinium_carterae.1
MGASQELALPTDHALQNVFTSPSIHVPVASAYTPGDVTMLQKTCQCLPYTPPTCNFCKLQI